MDSKALTKIQSAALIAVIVVAAVGGAVAYMFWSGPAQAANNIRIGVCADLDNSGGKAVWQAVVLAAEQVNAEGGVLGRNFTVVAEDNDVESLSGDIAVGTNALTKLITVDKADYVISTLGPLGFTYQDICYQQRKILISLGAGNLDELEQRVLDDYEKYKYFFSVSSNVTSSINGIVDNIMTLREYTGFKKVAWLDLDVSAFAQYRSGVKERLLDNGFDVVYQNSATFTTTDFTSYFAAIEDSGAEILFPLIVGGAGVSFVKEWYDRQAPFVVWGFVSMAQFGDFWELTDGKCEYLSFVGLPAIAGYPLTNRTLATRDAYVERWHENPISEGVNAYDFVRFILPAAIARAGTTEIEAMVTALEKTDVETSSARHFVFSSSHGVMVGYWGPNRPSMDYVVVCLFQWQNGIQVPVYPEKLLEEAGATYKYPPWQGPWSD